MGVNTPAEVMVIMHDGTGSAGLPKMRRRGVKNMTPVRFEVVPWLGIDYSQGQRMDYIYVPKLHVSKSTNYLLSLVHGMVRRTKSDYTKPNFRARKLIVIADSASENKNNEVFAYYSDMVAAGWFDTVELLFGPVGHTHNGVDAVHKIHNVDLGAYLSGDLGHMVQHYAAVWGGTPPGASVLNRVVDWKRYYGQPMRKVIGFRKSGLRETDGVRGYRIARQANGTVDVCFKPDPADPDCPDWLGKGGFPKTPGWFMLKQLPFGVPEFEPRLRVDNTTREMRDKLQAMRSGALANALRDQGLEACIEANCGAMQTGEIQIHRRLETATPQGQWGILCEVGAVEGKRGKMRFIHDFWDPTLPQEKRDTMWALPVGPNGEHVAAVTNHFHVSLDREHRGNAPFPMMRYADETVEGCEMANHARGQAAIRVGERNKKRKAAKAPGKKVPAKKPSPGADVGRGTGGAWQKDDDGVNGYRFDVDFRACKKGTFVLCVVVHESGYSPSLLVGEVTSVDVTQQTFKVATFTPNRDPWLPACLQGQWNPQKGKKSKRTVEEMPAHSVIAYFPKLNAGNRLPKSVKEAVNERKLKWATILPEPEEDPESNPDESESENTATPT